MSYLHRRRRLSRIVYLLVIGILLFLILRNSESYRGILTFSYEEGEMGNTRDSTLMIDDSAALALAKRIRIMCWIPSTENHLNSSVSAVNDTWVRRCDGHLFFVETNASYPDVVNLNIPFGRNHLTDKSVAAFIYIYHRSFRQYDWFLKGDGDTYVVMENLKFLLSHYDPNKPVYLGHLFKRYLKAGYMAGGASYILSKEALRLLIEEGYNKNLCPKTGAIEDVDIGICLNKVGVPVHNSLDIFGRETFHPLAPRVHIVGPIPENQIPQDRFKMVAHHNCCSELTVSFHKMDPFLIRIFEHLLYRLTVYGRISQLSKLNGLFIPKTIPPLP